MKNVVLIGMPGCGKSTVGVVLAKVIGFNFIDSDLLIQNQQNQKLSEIIKNDGVDAFHEIENKVNASMKVNQTVVATGGSAIYGKQAMENFKKNGIVIYLRLPYEEIKERLGDLLERGITLREGQSLLDLYKEREPVYENYADIILDTKDMTIRETVMKIENELENYIK